MDGGSQRPGPSLEPDVIWEAVPDGLVLVDEGGRIVKVNQAAREQFGYTGEQLIGEPVERLVPRESEVDHVAMRQDYAAAPERRPMGARRRLGARRSDGTVFPCAISLSPLVGEDGRYTIAAVRDMTDWVISEERLAQATRRRLLAEDHERIARELHDTVIQELFAVGMGLQALTGEIGAEGVADRLRNAIDALDDVIRGIRSVIFDVRHERTDDDGLRAAVVETVGSLTSALGFEPRLSFSGSLDRSVPVAVAEHLVPTVREALTNVARHAAASAAELSIEVTDEVVVRVIDNGRGVDPGETRRSGLANLANRAALLGGRLEVGRTSEGGTRLEWRVPIAR